MIVLGIDTSCDETSVAVYDAERKKILSNVVLSQVKIHSKYGGVVPEIAARKHAENIDKVFSVALEKAGVSVKDIDLVAVTNGPGLLPALLVGLTFGKGIAWFNKIPLKGVNHIEAHIFSPFVEKDYIPEKFLALVVSGGHTLLCLVSGKKIKVVGRTLDDAVGEGFDKTAKLLGLGYPGGPVIDKMFSQYSGEFLELPKPKVKGLDFSFSGLKSAVRRLAEKGYPKEMIAVSFQKTAIDYLFEKLKKAIEIYGTENIVVAGGVSANSYLRKKVKSLEESGFRVFLPSKELSVDNGAMVAFWGYQRFVAEGEDPLTLNAYSRLSF